MRPVYQKIICIRMSPGYLEYIFETQSANYVNEASAEHMEKDRTGHCKDGQWSTSSLRKTLSPLIYPRKCMAMQHRQLVVGGAQYVTGIAYLGRSWQDAEMQLVS